MRQSQARRRARIISLQSGRPAEPDRFRVTLFRGRLVRGGKRSIMQAWGVFDSTSGELLEPKATPEDEDAARGWW